MPAASANYSLFDGKRVLKNHFQVPLLSPRMIHEFGMTEKYAIVPDLPLEFDPPGAIKHKRFLFHFNKSAPARYGVFPRNSRDGKDVKWFEVEPHFVFHFGGQWDSVNEKGEEIVTLYVVSYPTIDIGFQFMEHWFDKNILNTFDKYEFNLTTLQTKKTTLIENMYLEFPNLSQDYYGYKSRYCYIACRAPIDEWPATTAELDDMLYTGFIKYDTKEEKIVKIVPFGEHCVGAEVYYQQRDGSDPLKDEDDGYVMTAVHDWKNNKSHFVMWDAKTLEPVLNARM